LRTVPNLQTKLPPVTALLYKQHIFLGTSQPKMCSHLKVKKKTLPNCGVRAKTEYQREKVHFKVGQKHVGLGKSVSSSGLEI
jgi:hypothetical protein